MAMCSECRYWHDIELEGTPFDELGEIDLAILGDLTLGTCRRYPPRLVIRRMEAAGNYPSRMCCGFPRCIGEGAACGEFRVTPPAP